MEESARDFRVGYDTLFKPPFSYQASTDLNRKRWPREIMGCHAVRNKEHDTMVDAGAEEPRGTSPCAPTEKKYYYSL